MSKPGHLGQAIDAVSRGAAKQKITPWNALVWAYAHENVRAANAHLPTYEPDYSSWDFSPRGAINGVLSCHADAIAIDALVMKKTTGRQYTVIARAAETRTPVPERLELAAYIPLPEPSDRFSGRIKVIRHPIHHRPWYCPLLWEGVPPDEAEQLQSAQANMHAVFMALLRYMEALVLERWVIEQQ